MGSPKPIAMLGGRCSRPYGPFVILHWPPQQWGVMRADRLDDEATCLQVLHAPSQACQALLCAPRTSPESVMPTLAAALLRVAALLKEEARRDPKQASDLLAERRIALAELWLLIDDTEPEQPHVRAAVRTPESGIGPPDGRGLPT